MKPPYKIKGVYPCNWIVDADDKDFVTRIECDIGDETDYMQIICDALNANSDPTLREVEIPAEMFPLPELPKGKELWIGRGYFGGITYGIFPNRKIRYYEPSEKKWLGSQHFSENVFHIEAI